jgi:hypothetical protein
MITVDDNLIRKKYYNALIELESVHDDLLSCKLNFNYDNIPITAKPCDYIRVILDYQNKKEFNSIKKLIYSTLFNAENRIPGSAFSLMYNLNKNSKEVSKNRICLDDLNHCLNSFFGNGQVKDAIINSIKEVGFEGKLSFGSLANSKENNIVVKSTSKIGIKAKVHQNFELKKYKLEDSVVIYVDGSIHEMSILESLVNFCYEKKINIILICHNFDLNVINTLNYNHKNNYYNLIPLVYQNVNDNYIIDNILKLNCGLINLESYDLFHNLFWLENIKKYDVYLEDDKINLKNENGDEKIVEFLFPKKMMNISGLLEDRISSGFIIAQNAAKTGLIEIKKDFFVPVVSYNLGVKTKNSLIKNIENLGCLIEEN